MDDAKKLYDLLNTEADINKTVEDKWQENIHIEAKCIEDCFENEKSKLKYAKTLSGFANADGGVVVWGIDASKGEDIDFFRDVKPIKKLKMFEYRLNELQTRLFDPHIEGIEHKTIPITEKTDTGYAVTYVPASEKGPHMSIVKEDHRYYQRTYDSTKRMAHHEIREAFQRGAKPKMELDTYVGPMVGLSNGSYAYLHVGVKNVGRGIAKHALLSIRISPESKFTLKSDKPNPAFPYMGFYQVNSMTSGLHSYAASANCVIHPKTSREVSRISFGFASGSWDIPDLRIEYEIAAENFPLYENHRVYSGKYLADIVKNEAYQTWDDKEFLPSA